MLKTINIDNEVKFYDTNLENHHHLYNTTMSTLTDIAHDKVVFAELPELPKTLEIESTEVLIIVFAELPELPKTLEIESTEVLIKARNK